MWLCAWLVMGTLSLSACGGESSENPPNIESEEPTESSSGNEDEESPENPEEEEGEEPTETPIVASFEPAPFDPVEEIANDLRQLQRQSEYLTPEYTARLAAESLASFLESFVILAKDPERQFLTDLCWSNSLPCAGDLRLYDWKKNGYGLVEPVLFTNRTGAIISGHVWATKAGPTADKRLLTNRWQNDSIDESLDKAGKGNMFSYKHGSRMKIKLESGATWHCEDLRTGCDGMYTDDGEADNYSFLTIVTTPE